jgi:Restriction endonuclease
MQEEQIFESIIANLHSVFYPNALITWNKKIVGVSGVERQIDVYIEDYSSLYPIKIVIDCKLYASKVDIKDVESTWMLVNDVRANLGIIICNSDYTGGAIKRARDIGLLKLCLPVDSEHKKFSAEMALPIIAQKGELEYTMEIYPKSLLPVMRKSSINEIYLENRNSLKKITMYKFILNHIETSEIFEDMPDIIGPYSIEQYAIEALNGEYRLFIGGKVRRFLKMIIKYNYTGKLVISSVPIKEGKGIFEVLGRDRQYIVGRFLSGSSMSIHYEVDAWKYWKWRDFDYKKDFPSVYFSSTQLEELLLDLKGDFI